MRVFVQFLLASSRKTIILVIALGAFNGFTSAGLIALVSQMFTNPDELGRNDLLLGAVVLGLVVVFMLVLEITVRYVLTQHVAEIHRDLHIKFTQLVLTDQLRRLEKIGIARLVTIFTEDMSLIGGALISISSVGTSTFVVLGCVAYLLWLSPGIVLTMIALCVPAFFVYRKMHKRSTLLAKQSLEKRDSSVSHFKSIAYGIKELQLNYKKRVRILINEFEPSINSHKDTYVKSSLVFSLGNAWIQLVYFSLMIAAMLYLVVSDGSPAVLGPFLVVALFMRGYITNILNTIPIWSRAGVALERLYDEGFQDVQIGSPLVAPKSSLHTQGEPLSIEVDGVSYQYDGVSKGSSFSVGPLNLTLNSGELVFVVGHNGAGKTTFAKVLSGLYSNGSGVIRCNGKPIEDSNRDSYRELFSVLFTDPYIFDTLFFEDGPNYANRVESNEIISHYLEKIQLNQKVSFNNDRLDSVDLSHGQRKRLALLAAYLENKPILIFDEWAENQDPEFKAVFYQELLPELTRMGKLVIVISHEAQYYSVADRIIELKANVEKSSIVTDRVLG